MKSVKWVRLAFFFFHEMKSKGKQGKNNNRVLHVIKVSVNFTGWASLLCPMYPYYGLCHIGMKAQDYR